MYTTQESVISLLKKGKINSRKDLRSLDIPHRKVGSGAFRDSFVIFPNNKKERFVIKFPITKTTPQMNVCHSQNELNAIKKISTTTKLAFLRNFLPTVLYSNYRKGIIAMEYYYRCREASQIAYVLERAYAGLYPARDVDIEYYNVRETKDGEYRLIDLGCFEY